MRTYVSDIPVMTDRLSPIRLPHQEKVAIRLAAKRQGKTISEFAREALAAAAATQAA